MLCLVSGAVFVSKQSNVNQVCSPHLYRELVYWLRILCIRAVATTTPSYSIYHHQHKQPCHEPEPEPRNHTETKNRVFPLLHMPAPEPKRTKESQARVRERARLTVSILLCPHLVATATAGSSRTALMANACNL